MSSSDQEIFFYGHIDQILDNESDQSLITQSGSYAQPPNLQKSLEQYTKARGRLQSVLGEQCLTEDELITIRDYSNTLGEKNSNNHNQVDNSLMLSHEVKNRRVKRIRQLLIYGAIVFAVLSLGRNLVYVDSIDFNPVEALSYETKVMEERPNQRLDLQTESEVEVVEFFQNFPRLGWKDNLLNIPDETWYLKGASLLDYEVVKISMIVYTKEIPGLDIVEEENEVVSEEGAETRIEVVRTKVPRKDVIVHYSFQSDKDYLPDIDPAISKGVEFYTFVSEEYNIIMWLDRNRYNLVFGRLTPIAMSEFIP